MMMMMIAPLAHARACVIGLRCALARLPCVVSMVILARLQWLAGELLRGRQCRIKLNSHDNRLIVHVALTDHFNAGNNNWLANATVNHMIENLPYVIAVDRGHRNSDGTSLITFMLKAAPMAPMAICKFKLSS